MRRWLLSLFVLTVMVFLPETAAKAYEKATYPTTIKVVLADVSSSTITIDGNYQLQNRQTNETIFLPATGSLKVTQSGGVMTVSDGKRSFTSKSGFFLQEMVNSTEKLATFPLDTPIRLASDPLSAEVGKVKANETVLVTDSVDAGGLTWLNVQTGGSGATGWIASSGAVVSKLKALPLATVGSLKYRGSIELTVFNNKVRVTNFLDMEDYLKGVVPSEMPASWSTTAYEAVKAQAIVARSYAKNTQNLYNSAQSQMYRGYSGEDYRTTKAIEDTKGLVVTYNGKAIQTFFHSTSGGQTANVGDVWNSKQANFPYLVSVDDPYEKSPYSTWTVNFAASDILKSFGLSTSASLYDVKLTKTANGEVKGVTIETSQGSKTMTGNEAAIRKLFPIANTSAYGILYSNWFDVALNKVKSVWNVMTGNGTVDSLNSVSSLKVRTTSGTVTLDTSGASVQTKDGIWTNKPSAVSSVVVNGRGWGHRIGMSQYGAKGLAEKGWTAEKIVTYYFPGTKVEKY